MGHVSMKSSTATMICIALTGCASFQPKDGMTYQEFRKMSVLSVNGEPVMTKQVGQCEIYMLRNSNRDLAPTNSVAKSLYDPNKDYGYVFKENKLIDTITAPELASYRNTSCPAPIAKLQKNSSQSTAEVKPAINPNISSWEQEKANVLKSSKTFVITVACTDERYIKSRGAYFAFGEGTGISAVTNYYGLEADVNPRGKQAFLKSDYLCRETKMSLNSSQFQIIDRGPRGMYIIKLNGKDLYSAIKGP